MNFQFHFQVKKNSCDLRASQLFECERTPAAGKQGWTESPAISVPPAPRRRAPSAQRPALTSHWVQTLWERIVTGKRETQRDPRRLVY